jgi:Ser/Thr protein kinase RdoA (MazF antagonist)
MPHGYTNRTMRNGPVVTKAYQGPEATCRCTREAAVLCALAGRLPVPEVIDSGGGRLHLTLMDGVPGQDLIDAGLAEPVLRACGQMLRRVQAIDPTLAHVDGHSPPPAVLVHGDYGPNNVLLDPAARQVTAIVDWEWAHVGHPVEDLAWCEWIVRMHHPADVGALGALFDGYGSAPAWSARHQAMLAQCRVQLDLSEQWQPGGENARRWQQRLAITQAWTE